ncbi:MAG: glycerophosphoryl diester phosphodiesterase membrane domain-containing protein [Ornithinimicrobium sp.]|uniref:glycerophosphoryl diester phosphodiesterase membrane domain-containing protein n=1 Tax=Ornithinimicrobium sp. TaxID=1977084 RepID=UPI003D9B92C0
MSDSPPDREWAAPGRPAGETGGPPSPPPQYQQPGQYQQPPPGQYPPPGQGAPPPGWQQLSPEQISRMHRPGIIPLGPLNLSDIFGGALVTMRRNPEATLGMAVIVLGVVLVPSLLLSLGLQQLSSLSFEDVSIVGLVLPTLLSGLASLALSGFVIFVVSEAALGDKVSLGQTWRQVRGRLLALIGVTLLTTLVIVLASVPAAILVGVGAAIGGVGGGTVIVLGVLGMVVLLVWVGIRLMLSPAPVVLERAGPIQGIRRSWTLTKGSQWWRIFGIYLLAALVAQIFATIVAAPLQAILLAVVGSATPDTSVALTATVLVQHLSQFLTGVVVTPFTAGVIALLYLDQRIRREGLDLSMQRAAQQRAAERGRQ